MEELYGVGCKVAVIDSAVSNSLILIENQKLSKFYIEKDEIIEKKEETSAITHGTLVLNNILYECKDIEVLSIELLDKNNKGKAIYLLQAIEFCIREKVSFINLSLGIVTTNSEFISALDSTCKKAIQNGIIIISAMSNAKVKSYPAIFPYVISVSSSCNNKTYCTFDETINDLCFRSSSILSKGMDDLEVLTGNSYLCGYLTGVICCYSKEINNLEDARKVIKHVWGDEIRNKIYINPCSDSELSNDVVFVYFEDNSFDVFLEKNIIGNIERYSWSEFKEKNSLDIDTIVLGGIKLPCEPTIKEEIICWIFRMKKKISRVYSFTPIFNTKERYEMADKYGIDVKTIYI